MSDIVYKTFSIKDLNDAGQVSAVISTFQLDRDGDVMTAAAFKRSDGKTIPMVYSHNWEELPIGKGVVKVGDSGAEFHGQFFLDTQAGQEAYKTVKAMGDLQEYSIGFNILDASWDKKDGEPVRTIKDIELFEASPVLVGAAYGTHTLAIKSALRALGRRETKAQWDTAFINNLPDSAFAVVLSGGEKDSDDKTTPRDLRKLPHHGTDGSVDLPHLRNALSREPQTEMPEEDHAKALHHLQAHAAAAGIGDDGKSLRKQAALDEETFELVASQIETIETAAETLEMLLGIQDDDDDDSKVAAILDRVAKSLKSGRQLSQANLDRVHSIKASVDAMHKSTCDMGDDCPADEEKSTATRSERDEIERLLAGVRLGGN